MLWTALRIVLALGGAVLIYLAGAAMVRHFKFAPPAEPDPDDLRPVDAEFECVVCGARVTMTATQRDTELEAPRHCREDMVPVASGTQG